MDITLYGLSGAATEGIWAALIGGAYNNTDPGDNWALAFNNNDDIINLQGTEWSKNEWLAGVTGTVDGNDIEGTAAGTYAIDPTGGTGEFAGVGTGTWETPPTQAPPTQAPPT